MGGHHWIWQENFKTKILAPTSNLNWLQAAVSKCNSGANVVGIWPGAKYKSYRTLSHLSNSYLYALIWSTVWELRIFKIDGCWNSVLDRIEHPEQSDFFTIIRSDISGTFNTNIADNVLSFLMHPYMTYLVKRNQSYYDLKTAWKRWFQQKAEKNFAFGEG
jgi:hypothetical protein